MKLDGKQIVRMAAVLVVLPILYAASSGPALRYALDHSQPNPGSTFKIVTRPPVTQCWASESFYRSVRSFYNPLFRFATASGLEQPIFAYLNVWKVVPIKFGDHTFMVVRIYK
jgi:hypothetical protein